MKEQINKTLIFIAIYITIVVTGVFAVADIWKTQGLTSKVYGALNIQTNNDLKENEFKFIYTGFKETADGKYSFTQTNITNLTDLSNYSIRINSRDCKTQSTTSTMFCDYSVAFKNYENNIILSDSLNISVALHSGNLTFIFVTKNENALPYWNKHFDLEGFTLELVESKNFEIEAPVINKFESVICWTFEGKEKTIEVENNQITIDIYVSNVLPFDGYVNRPSSEDLELEVKINDIAVPFFAIDYECEKDSINLGYLVNNLELYTNDSLLENSNLIIQDSNYNYFNAFYNTELDTNSGALRILGATDPLVIEYNWHVTYME